MQDTANNIPEEDKARIVLGIETSCDETSAALVREDGTILSNVVLSQLDEHRPYSGVVPEIAARAHLDHLDRLIRQALDEAGLGFEDLDAVAATAGPGLIGGVFVGIMTAKAIAAARNLPFIAVNQLEGHALTTRMTSLVDAQGRGRGRGQIAFPYLLLLVSGGHCQLLIVKGPGDYQRLGTTIDDAAGEAFDKAAKLMGLGYPGGPRVEAMARDGEAQRFAFPRPMKGRKGCDFSFSGLKTAVRQAIDALPEGDISQKDAADICASFQAAVADVLEDRCSKAMDLYLEQSPAQPAFVVAGGVAANKALRGHLEGLCARKGLAFYAPPLSLCTDNGAMIAWAGVERLRLGLTDPLDFKARPRWPLDPNAKAAPGAGVKA